MARVLVLTRDLLFGSQVQGALALAGHDVELVADEQRLRQLLADGGDPTHAAVDVVVVDLTDEALDGAATVRALSDSGALGAARTLGFYSHVDTAAREHAERAGIHLIIARSRMAREGPQLVAGLLAAAGTAGD
jgi:DNA-binding NarL/FixJ family response regulator